MWAAGETPFRSGNDTTYYIFLYYINIFLCCCCHRSLVYCSFLSNWLIDWLYRFIFFYHREHIITWLGVLRWDIMMIISPLPSIYVLSQYIIVVSSVCCFYFSAVVFVCIDIETTNQVTTLMNCYWYQLAAFYSSSLSLLLLHGVFAAL